MIDIPSSDSARVLRIVVAGLALLSLVLVVWPTGGARAFSLLVYQRAEFPDDFSPEARAYIRLVHAVLGAVMAAWFVTLFAIAPCAARERALARALAGAVLVWFVPDTAYSLLSGFWENALLNLMIVVVLLGPLTSLSRRAARRPPSPDGSALVSSRSVARGACAPGDP
jgi:hypothetical protein